jgi:dihydropteroate synthase
MQLRLGSRILDLDQPRVMGILNVTPDSFSDGGRFVARDAALHHAESMLVAGASIIDVGGESTRPGADAVSAGQEIERIVPIVADISQRLDIAISVDTSKAEVMQAAAEAGASMINDVYALQLQGALEMAAALDVAVCLVHMQGTPVTMQANPQYRHIPGDIIAFLSARIATCRSAGIGADRLLVDPGFGFGKDDRHNLEILCRLEQLTRLGPPLLVGLSRKRLLGNLTGKPVDQRLSAGVAAAVLAIERGARIIRTHDVAETMDALRITQAVMNIG